MALLNLTVYVRQAEGRQRTTPTLPVTAHSPNMSSKCVRVLKIFVSFNNQCTVGYMLLIVLQKKTET